MPTQRFDAVLFDCDGVLVDSEPITCRVHAETLTRHGYPVTAEEVRARFLGRSARDANAEIERELGRPLPAAYDPERRAALLAALAESTEAIPHVHAALDAIAAPVCVASSGAHDKIFTTLMRAGLYHRFAPNIFSAFQVKAGKPAPAGTTTSAPSTAASVPAVSAPAATTATATATPATTPKPGEAGGLTKEDIWGSAAATGTATKPGTPASSPSATTTTAAAPGSAASSSGTAAAPTTTTTPTSTGSGAAASAEPPAAAATATPAGSAAATATPSGTETAPAAPQTPPP